jgi:hypothetical protein
MFFAAGTSMLAESALLSAVPAAFLRMAFPVVAAGAAALDSTVVDGARS